MSERGGKVELLVDAPLQALRVGHRPHRYRMLGQARYGRDERDGSCCEHETPIGHLLHSLTPRSDKRDAPLDVDVIDAVVANGHRRVSEQRRKPQLAELGARRTHRDQVQFRERLLTRIRLDEKNVNIV